MNNKQECIKIIDGVRNGDIMPSQEHFILEQFILAAGFASSDELYLHFQEIYKDELYKRLQDLKNSSS